MRGAVTWGQVFRGVMQESFGLFVDQYIDLGSSGEVLERGTFVLVTFEVVDMGFEVMGCFGVVDFLYEINLREAT